MMRTISEIKWKAIAVRYKLRLNAAQRENEELREWGNRCQAKYFAAQADLARLIQANRKRGIDDGD